jgi:GDPmannose 4,6-dehydratase
MRVVIGVMVGFIIQFLVRHDLMFDNFLAKDYVEGMWMMLQQEKAEDFVLATGETHPVREFIIKAFEAAGITLRYLNRNHSGLFYFLICVQVGRNWRRRDCDRRTDEQSCGQGWSSLLPSSWSRVSVQIILHSIYPHINLLSLLLGNPAKAERVLGWKRRIDFDALVKEMVAADLKAAASLVEDQN